MRLSRGYQERLAGNIRKGRRDTIYKMLKKKHDGSVPCFVCGRHVDYKNATLEHILPRSKGGTDAMDSLAISHFQCNQRRGNLEIEGQKCEIVIPESATDAENFAKLKKGTSKGIKEAGEFNTLAAQ